MSSPDTPLPPRFLLKNADRLVLIGTEGGISLLHPEKLTCVDSIHSPFPGVITNAILLDENHLVATWVEREVSLARLAKLDLREPLQDGIELADLRISVEAGNVDQQHVSGAEWSHILDAEPLALCAHENDIVFCTHFRGIYRVNSDSEEMWRQKPMTWSSLEELPDGEVIISMITAGDAIWAFSLAGGWVEMDAASGEIRKRGSLQFKSSVKRVWKGENGDWLFGLSQNRIAWWSPSENSLLIEDVQGPIQDALSHQGNWYITGWREDIIWASNNPTKLEHESRKEIGNHILLRGETDMLVLDNRGQWTPFGPSIF